MSRVMSRETGCERSWKLAAPEDDIYVSFGTPLLGMAVATCGLLEKTMRGVIFFCCAEISDTGSCCRNILSQSPPFFKFSLFTDWHYSNLNARRNYSTISSLEHFESLCLKDFAASVPG